MEIVGWAMQRKMCQPYALYPLFSLWQSKILPIDPLNSHILACEFYLRYILTCKKIKYELIEDNIECAKILTCLA